MKTTCWRGGRINLRSPRLSDRDSIAANGGATLAVGREGMEFFDVATTQRSIRRLKADPIPEAVLHQIMDAAVCAPSGGNRQGWSFVVIRDAATRASVGALYRECWGELMKTPYCAGVSGAPSDSREGKMLASARHLSEHLGEAPVLVVACIATDGARPTLTTGASIYPAIQNLMLAAR